MHRKRISAQEAAGFVRSDMWIDYGTSLRRPDVFDKARGERVQEFGAAAPVILT